MCFLNTRDVRLSVLKRKVFFRFLVIISPSILFYFSSTYIYNAILQNILLGISCSLFAWASVDLIDFSIDSYSLYIDERHTFLSELINRSEKITQHIRCDDLINHSSFKEQETFEEIDSILKGKNQKTLDKVKSKWLDSQKAFDDLHNYIALFPLSSKLYCCSSEYEKIYNYIDRCYWLFQGCTSSDKINIPRLYDGLIEKTTTKNSYTLERFMKDTDFITHTIPSQYQEMQTIAINDEPYSPPDELFSPYHYGIIRAYTINQLGEHHSTTSNGILRLTPSKRIEEAITAKHSNICFIQILFILSLIFPKHLHCLELYHNKKQPKS